MITHTDRVVALIDGDIITVRAAAVNEGGDPDDIQGTIHHLIREWTEAAHADTCKVFVSEGKCFRYQAYPEYKSNRKNKPKPPGTDYAKEYLLEKYAQELSDPLLEADDRMGLYSTEDQDEEIRIIVSTDKDMRQVPAYQMSPDHHRFPWRPTMAQCNRMRAMQVLCGDPVDGYPGIKGFGPKKFEKEMEKEDERQHKRHILDVVEDIYTDREYDNDYFSSQMECATIFHHQLEGGYMDAVRALYW